MDVKSQGILYLIPAPLSDDGGVGEPLRQVVSALDGVLAESRKCALGFLRRAGVSSPDRVSLRLMSEHTRPSELEGLLEPMTRGERWGLMSDAGCPAVADPGCNLVRLAHERGVRVSPLVGPSAILLALMASGLNGQRFAFHGYLSRDADQRRRELRELEADSKRSGRTQIWMETPYRNPAVLSDALSVLGARTWLSLAVDLTANSETIQTRTIAAWRKGPPPDIKNRPAIFLLSAEERPGRA